MREINEISRHDSSSCYGDMSEGPSIEIIDGDDWSSANWLCVTINHSGDVKPMDEEIERILRFVKDNLLK
jgi:hypothetical protein